MPEIPEERMCQWMYLIGMTLHYGGKITMGIAALWLPVPLMIVVWGWIVSTTGLTVAINASQFLKENKEKRST